MVSCHAVEGGRMGRASVQFWLSRWVVDIGQIFGQSQIISQSGVVTCHNVRQVSCKTVGSSTTAHSCELAYRRNRCGTVTNNQWYPARFPLVCSLGAVRKFRSVFPLKNTFILLPPPLHLLLGNQGARNTTDKEIWMT